ncbi:PEGA domain-containing protein [Sorangium sp. So ce136]|uniref:PEGA domain-containing protein n=1 Tax=Sorangium sp. So ce136 TaxID=3133284 RepID=UPI003F0A1B44
MRAAARSLVLWACVTLAAAPAAALADARPASEQAARAEAFFNAGAQAYDAGQYQVAAEAFLEAHELVPSPALLFSAAQAFRRQYLTQAAPDALRRAVALYRDYLRADPKAARREEAVDALEALVPLEARLAGEGLAVEGAATGAASARGRGDAAAASPPAGGTRLLLSSRAEGARVSVDGQPFVPAPLVAPVAPGPHRVRVQATGHYEEELTVVAVSGELMPAHVVLRPKPAQLHVTGTGGARVAVDGQERATVPTAAPIAVEPGAHVFEVSLPGHQVYRQEIRVAHEQTVRFDADLRMTPRRIAAWAVLGVGAAGVVATGALAGLALARQGEAVELRDRQDASSLTPSERDRYNAAVNARGRLGAAAAIAGGVSFAAFAVGFRLFAFDEPRLSGAPAAPAPPAKAPGGVGAEFTVGLLSAGVRGRF